MGRGFGGGFGRGRRLRFRRTPYPIDYEPLTEEDKEILEQEVQIRERELKGLRKRLDEFK
jgi:hypothetical protein